MPPYKQNSTYSYRYATYTDGDEEQIRTISNPVILVSRREGYPKGLAFTSGLFLSGIGLELWAVVLLYTRLKSLWGWGLAILSLGCWICGFLSVYFSDKDGTDRSDNHHIPQHNSAIVPQKYLDVQHYLGYIYYRGLDMANVLSVDKKIAVIGALAEGSSIRSIERITGVHRDTIMRLGVKVGQGCTALMDAKMRNLSCKRLEMDEIWGFVGKKERNVHQGDSLEIGSVWTWCVIDADTKLVPAFMVGDRSHYTANAFVEDVAKRMAYKVQLSTDGYHSYAEAVRRSFGQNVDYGQIVKVYGTMAFGERRYSTSGVLSSEKSVKIGRPDVDLISTSYVERLNATTRLHMRRLTRLTLAFSKKRENFEAAVGLHFAYYNFVKRHNTLRCTPAMAAGVTGTQWKVGDLVEAVA